MMLKFRYVTRTLSSTFKMKRLDNKVIISNQMVWIHPPKKLKHGCRK